MFQLILNNAAFDKVLTSEVRFSKGAGEVQFEVKKFQSETLKRKFDVDKRLYMFLRFQLVKIEHVISIYSKTRYLLHFFYDLISAFDKFQ